MKRKCRFFKLSVIFLCFGVIGCVSVPKGFLKPSEGFLESRQLQMRQYDTTNQEQIITAVSGVLQDLGFTLDDSETEVGFIAASKKADASSKGQMFWAGLVDVLNAVGGTYSNASAQCDATQVIKASVITKLSLDSSKTIVRVTFQRIVWNVGGQINKIESLKEPEIYQKFYDSLSKAIFLEAQNI